MLVDLERLQSLFVYRGNRTNCGDSNEFICRSLKSNYDVEVAKQPLPNTEFHKGDWVGLQFSPSRSSRYNPNKLGLIRMSQTSSDEFYLQRLVFQNKIIQTITDNFNVSQIMKCIRNALTVTGYVSIYVDLHDDNHAEEPLFEHVFVLCQTTTGCYTVDSYLMFRALQISPYREEHLIAFLSEPTIENYNILCDVRHRDRRCGSQKIPLSANIDIFYPTTEPESYRNVITMN